MTPLEKRAGSRSTDPNASGKQGVSTTFSTLSLLSCILENENSNLSFCRLHPIHIPISSINTCSTNPRETSHGNCCLRRLPAWRSWSLKRMRRNSQSTT